MTPKNIFIVRKPNYICLGNIAYHPNNLINMKQSVFYHAGCPVCVSAEHEIISLLGQNMVEVVHLGHDKQRLAEAQKAGVESVPALVTPSGNVLHINFGAFISDLNS